MTRKKVVLEWIANDSARKASLKKRRAGLLKKVGELCILCGVVACVIVYSPNEIEPVFFPSSRSEVEEILLRFEQIPEMDKTRKMVNQESYVKERITKHQDQLQKTMKKNREMQMNHFLHQIHRAAKPFNEFAHNELHGLRFYVEERWRECRRKMQFFQHGVGEPLPPSPVHNMAPAPAREHNGAGQWYIDMMRNDQGVAGSSSNNKGKAVLHEYEGSSGHAAETAVPQEHLGVQGNEEALFNGGHDGVLQYQLPQEQSVLAPYGVIGGTAEQDSNIQAISYGHGMVYPQGEAQGGNYQYGIQGHEYNAGGTMSGLDLSSLLHRDVGGSNWMYSMNSGEQGNGSGENGHATLPLHGGIQGREEGYAWTQQDWNARASNNGYASMFANPYGDVGGNNISGLYGMRQFDLNLGGIGGDYPVGVYHGDAATSGDAYGLSSHQMNNGGATTAHWMMLNQGEGGSNNGGYGLELHQRNDGTTSLEQQGAVIDLGDGGRNNFSTGLRPDNPMNVEQPEDPWAPYYSTGGSSRVSNYNQNPGEGKY